MASRYLPLVVGGRRPDVREDLALLLIAPAIFVISTFIYELLVLVSTCAAKWILLGRFREGSFSVTCWGF